VANPTILVPLHLPGRRHNGSLPEKQLARNAPWPYQVFKLQRMRNRMSNADSDPGLGLEKVQRLGMHPLHGMHWRMPSRSTLPEVPLEAYRRFTNFVMERGVVIQKKPDVPGLPGSCSFYPTIRDLKR